MYKVLVNRDDQFVKKLDENNAKLKFIPKEIEKLKIKSAFYIIMLILYETSKS